ncbi:MAG: glycolate oxidase [Methanolobus sp.]|jgi:glycolate oxidase subunit GlcD|uniref:FAD-binding oxidoreductase n=1 Tax=Methanolobus sp. TaxID=1874737 RepID=UPI0024ABC5C1|nr:FAD-linked oxidase C-terminal domain-containing protein [Methanolobus sp.]MDI3487197.1 glycolate oxidase [Methanolobus sp.]MDK2831922.1 glycolate oxidase [Methanolobus sp.]MDK2938367.1 glycolate oxidase [Methanolobus sp.]
MQKSDLLKKLQEIVGDEHVSTSAAELYCYSCDASQIRGMPDFVIRPVSTEQISNIVRLANENEIPVTARGAGTGLAGGAVPVEGGIVLDMSAMNRILETDLDNLQVTIEPGIVQEKLNQALEPSGLFFPPDPGSSAMCTLGGLIANNGSGMRSVKYGTTRNYVLGLEVVLADGTVINTGSKASKSVAGYSLTDLFVGSEGTLGIITKAILRLRALPKERSVLLASFEDPELAGQAVVKVLSSGIVPSACEILDRNIIEAINTFDPKIGLPKAGAILMFEVDGTENTVREGIEMIKDACSTLATSIRAASDKKERDEIWAARRLVGAAVSRLDPLRTRVYVGEDIGVPIKELPGMLHKVREISEEFKLPIMTYGHIGDGNLHTGMCIDVLSDEEWEKLNKAADKIHRTAIGIGGTVTAEHGVGSARADYLELELGKALDVMILIKNALDPKGIMNPGKMGV